MYLISAHFKEILADEYRRGLLYDAYEIFVSDGLYKSICCGCSFELPRLVQAIQMSTQNMLL